MFVTILLWNISNDIDLNHEIILHLVWVNIHD